MRTIFVTLALLTACGKTKVEVEDSEHTVTIGAEICEIFDDKEERKDCVRKILTAVEKECAK